MRSLIDISGSERRSPPPQRRLLRQPDLVVTGPSQASQAGCARPTGATRRAPSDSTFPPSHKLECEDSCVRKSPLIGSWREFQTIHCSFELSR